MSVDWYYALGDERKGPVNDQEFQRLIQLGIITRGTLVWNETMESWQPHTDAPLAPPPLKVASDTVRWASCSGCRKSFQESELVQLSDMRFCHSCKELAVQKMREGVSENQDEEIRKKHLSHEASIKSVGTLYIASSLLFLLATLGLFLPNNSTTPSDPTPPAFRSPFLAAVLLFFAFAQLTLGFGVRKLKSWTRIPICLLSGVGLFAVPVGTLINTYILYLVLCKKGQMVYSDDYRGVMERTPHLQYRMNRFVVGLLVLVGIFLLVGLVLWGVSRMR